MKLLKYIKLKWISFVEQGQLNYLIKQALLTNHQQHRICKNHFTNFHKNLQLALLIQYSPKPDFFMLKLIELNFKTIDTNAIIRLFGNFVNPSHGFQTHDLDHVNSDLNVILCKLLIILSEPIDNWFYRMERIGLVKHVSSYRECQQSFKDVIEFLKTWEGKADPGALKHVIKQLEMLDLV